MNDYVLIVYTDLGFERKMRFDTIGDVQAKIKHYQMLGETTSRTFTFKVYVECTKNVFYNMNMPM